MSLINNGDTNHLNAYKYSDEKLIGIKNRIDLAIRLHDVEKVAAEIKELFVYKESNFEQIDVHVAFSMALIDAYKFALSGYKWNNRIQDKHSTWKSRNTLEMILDELHIIRTIDDNLSDDIEKLVDDFFDYLYRIITEPVSTDNNFRKWPGRLKAVHSYGTSSIEKQSDVCLESLAYDFLIGKHYPPKYDKVYVNKIQPVFAACQKHYIGCDRIFGRFVEYPGYYIDDGYKCGSSEYKMIDYSITELEQIYALQNHYKGIMSPSQIEFLENKLLRLKWGISDKKCRECNNKLSLFGKCKTIGCENYGKSLQTEANKLQNELQQQNLLQQHLLNDKKK